MSEPTLERAKAVAEKIERKRESRRLGIAELREKAGENLGQSEEWRLGLYEGQMYALEWVLRELYGEDHSAAVRLEFYPASTG